MSPHNTRDEFRQLLKADGIDTVFRINPAGRIYGITFINHTNGIVANGSVLGNEFSANVFNELYPVLKNDKQLAEQQYSEQKYEQRNLTANPISGIVNAVLDLADTQVQEEQQRIQKRRRRKKAMLNCKI